MQDTKSKAGRGPVPDRKLIRQEPVPPSSNWLLLLLTYLVVNEGGGCTR